MVCFVWCDRVAVCGWGLWGRRERGDVGWLRAVDVEFFGGFGVVANQGVLAKGLEAGFAVDVGEDDAPEAVPIDIGDIVDDSEDMEFFCEDLFLVTSCGDLDLVVDVVFDALSPKRVGGVLAFVLQQRFERRKQVIQFADDRDGFAFIGVHCGMDRAAVRVSHDHQQGSFEVQDTVIDGTHRCKHLVSDISDGKDVVVWIAVKECFMNP